MRPVRKLSRIGILFSVGTMFLGIAPTPAADVGTDTTLTEAEILSATYRDIERGATMKALSRLQAWRDADSTRLESSGSSAYLRALYSWVGLHKEALEEADRRASPRKDSPTPQLQGLKPRPALDVIARVAGNSQLLMLNEAHHAAQHRAFAIELLVEMRKRGYTHFAAETLATSDTNLIQRGYPTTVSGFYSGEPLYGDLIRTALRLGYKVIAYEAIDSSGPEEREEKQARNIIDRVFKVDARARLVILAGYGHIDESGAPNAVRTLAQRLRVETGIDPITIDQTRMSERGSRSYEYASYRQAMDTFEIDQPTVLVNETETPWSDYPQHNDLVVFAPRSRYEFDRPTWLKINGARRSLRLKGNLCEGRLKCLVSARFSSEADDAIPVDQLLVDSSRPFAPHLVVPKGKFVVTVTDETSKVMRRFKIRR